VAPEAREEVLRRTRADYEQPYESVGLRRDGSTFPAEFCGHRIEHDGSRARLGAIWDITERKRQEDELRRAKEAAEQATRAKSRFLAAAGHDLRQPVTVLRMSLDMLAQRRQGLPDAKYLPRAERALGTLERALDEVMEVAKLEAGKLRPKPRSFALGELLDELREAWLPLAEGKGVTLRLRPCALPIRSDPAMLRRVLDNLVGNAIKYTERGGVLIGCRRRGDRLRIEVVDSGIGMPEDQIELAFQEFQRLYAASADGRESGAGGLGLGLSIVRRMADSLGHRVTARSTVGRGSRFTVEVPIAVPSRPAGTSPAPAEADATPCELT
jgi:signal transduction histidine kinase